jgi:hypothetical protein
MNPLLRMLQPLSTPRGPPQDQDSRNIKPVRRPADGVAPKALPPEAPRFPTGRQSPASSLRVRSDKNGSPHRRLDGAPTPKAIYSGW